MKSRIILITICGLFLLMMPLAGQAEIVDSGTCGDNLTWEITGDEGDYTLTITGTGEMYNFGYAEEEPDCPWRAFQISHLFLNEGITSIGERAFAGQTMLVDPISIPSTVESIHPYAFSDC